VAIGWYLVVSALIFCIGAGGVLTRRNPLVVLLCLELMLNAANLALVAFSRMWGGEDGQVFALIVMVVAACEVTVGLGLIVAMYRRQLPIDVDEMSELNGLAPDECDYVRLACPALPAGGDDRHRSGIQALARASLGVDRDDRDRARVRVRADHADHAARQASGPSHVDLEPLGLRRVRRCRREAPNPR
jgi:NADH-quinone oxidoreductase subunit K